MKTQVLVLLLLTGIIISCSQSSSPDPSPTPTPDFKTCRYTLNYSLRYSPLNKNKPTTITYLDSTQRVRRVVLTDTSFNLAVTYKHGDSVYVKLSPSQLHFAASPSRHRIIIKSAITTANISNCPAVRVATIDNKFEGISRDSIPTSPFVVAPLRIGY